MAWTPPTLHTPPWPAVDVAPLQITDAVVCARNEADTITQIVTLLANRPGVGQVIVVDDQSTDNTGQLAQAAGATVVQGPGQGKGQAMTDGLRHVTTPRTLFCDADLHALTPAAVDQLCAYNPPGQVCAIRRGSSLWKLPPITGERTYPTDLALTIPLTGWCAEIQLDAAVAAQRLPNYHVRTGHTHKTGRLTPAEAIEIYGAAIILARDLIHYPPTVTLIGQDTPTLP